MLVDLSTTGAQVLSPTSLRPGQRVRMSMVDEESSLKFGATVVRASFELSTGRGFTGYRAGVNFLDADRARVADFCNRNRKPSERHAAARATTDDGSAAPEPSFDERKRRKARRLNLREDAFVTVDGDRSSLVDLSASGAQVVAPMALRPGKTVRVALNDQQVRLRFSARVVWASYEVARGDGPSGYRAGLHFIDASREQVSAFGARNRLAPATTPTVSFPPVTIPAPASPAVPNATSEAPALPAVEPAAPPAPVISPMETARSEPETPVEPASAPPKRTSRKKKAAKRDKTTKTASTANTAKTPRTATKKGSAAGQLRDLKEGARWWSRSAERSRPSP